MYKKLIMIGLAAAIALGAGLSSNAQTLEEVLAGDHRSDGNKARDVYRNPVETLNFFGIKNDMTVVEIAPGGGWYQEVLAPYLNANGQYVSATSDEGSDGYKNEKNRHDANPGLYSNVKMVPMNGSATYGDENSADMVLSFRNYHNWIGSSEFNKLQAFYDTLKPGGILGMVDHRSNDSGDGAGYTCEPCMIKDAEAIGFIYVGAIQVNANPKDPKNHPGGVWNLPPVMSDRGLDANNIDAEKARLRAIGESDRYTLKFMKPMH